MKIKILEPEKLFGVSEKIIHQGDSISEDSFPPLFSLSSTYSEDSFTLGPSEPLANMIAEKMVDLSFNPSLLSECFLWRIFLPSQGFLTQVMLGIPLRGVMNSNLGASCISGMIMRFLPLDSSLSSMLGKKECEKFLEECDFSGFVSLGLSVSGELTATSLTLGLPEIASYNVLEALPGKISQFLSDPSRDLLESWTVSLVLSRFPWPRKEKLPQYEIFNYDSITSRHFWPSKIRVIKKSSFSTSTLLGVASAWAPTLSEASKRAIRTCRNICFPEKQFRTDIPRRVQSVLENLSAELLIDAV